MPTYRIVTLGCKLNQADSSALESRLKRLGLSRVPEPADRTARAGAASSGGTVADLVVLNTCTVTAGADREARQLARRLRRANPAARLVVTGCYAERDGATITAMPGVDHVVGMRDQAERVASIAAAAFGLAVPLTGAGAAFDLGPFGATEACDPAASDRTRAFLKVQDGCDLRCAYCIIPSVRGGSRSLPADEVARRIADLTGAGYREIVFTGVNTGDWGRDLEPPAALEHLMARAIAVPGLGRLRLNSLEPKTVTAEVVRMMAEAGGRVAPHLQVPLQSGSDVVLARMRRNYRTADYLRAVAAIRSAVPEAGLGADVIVGFPGETDAEFEATCRFIESSPLDYLHVFSYSPRPGTPAAAMPSQVPPAAIRERSARLRALAGDLSLRFRRGFVGREVEVLVLREMRPDGRLRALSGNFIDLGLDPAGRPAGELINRLVTARVTAVTPDDTLALVRS